MQLKKSFVKKKAVFCLFSGNLYYLRCMDVPSEICRVFEMDSAVNCEWPNSTTKSFSLSIRMTASVLETATPISRLETAGVCHLSFSKTCQVAELSEALLWDLRPPAGNALSSLSPGVRFLCQSRTGNWLKLFSKTNRRHVGLSRAGSQEGFCCHNSGLSNSTIYMDPARQPT